MRTTITLLALVLSLAGCQRTGLSPQEGQGQYQNYIAALYDAPRVAGSPSAAGAAATPGAPLVGPIRLAVAQLGEVSPSAEALAQLRAQPQLFAVVQPIPASSDPMRHYGNSVTDTRAEAKAHLDRMMRLAADLNTDYLYLYGGTVDYGTESNPLSVFDLTIVGAFIVPGKTVKAEAKASGALIELRTGRVVFLTTAEDRKGTIASTAASSNAEAKVLHRLRGGVVTQLVENFIAETPKHMRPAAYVPAGYVPAGYVPAAGYAPAPVPAPSQPTNPYWKR